MKLALGMTPVALSAGAWAQAETTTGVAAGGIVAAGAGGSKSTSTHH